MSETTDQTHRSSINTLITEHGRKPFQPLRSEYVLHTSTIPLATTLDLQYARRKSKANRLVSLFHGETDEHPDVLCSKRSCMYLREDRSRCNEKVKSNCPCLTIQQSDGLPLSPICFLTYIKSLNRNLVGQIDEDAFRIEPSKIMFCQDSQGCFDNKYPGEIRDMLGVTGWGHISNINYLELMDSLFWYRTNKKQYKLDTLLRKVVDKRGLPYFKRILKQTLYTLDGLIVKKLVVFGPELGDYYRFAGQTARLFKDLFSEYAADSLADLPPEMENSSLYSEMKDHFNHCKEFFYKGTHEEKQSWLNWPFKNKGLGAFWGTEMRRLKAYIFQHVGTVDGPYTSSLAWIFRSTTFCQTRNLGYLPTHLSEIKFASFREAISRPVEKLGPENDRLIRMAVRNRFERSEVREGFLQHPEGDVENAIAQQVYSKINLDLKGSASIDHKIIEGGKLEDARLTIRRIIDYGWKVPVRSLETNEVLEWIMVTEGDYDERWNRILFWFSYQLALNWLCERGMEKEEYYVSFPLSDTEDYSDDILRASIVHIMEPGKARNLVKGTGLSAWFLTPAAKILQATLALLPEHRAGLELSAHDWVHTRRTSSESDESGFIYNQVGGTLNPGVSQVFKDWQESTDFIGKRVGAAHLSAMMDYIGFPQAYGEMVIKIIREPQPVTEVMKFAVETDGVSEGTFREIERTSWISFVREGYMMGMPVTKVILHLIHVSELETAILFLRKRGIIIKEGFKHPPVRPDKVFLPRHHDVTNVVVT